MYDEQLKNKRNIVKTTFSKQWPSRSSRRISGIQELHRKAELMICGPILALITGCTTYVERPVAVYPPPPSPREVVVAPPAPVYVEPPPVEPEAAVQIRGEADFYGPLTPYGRWEVVGSYGRCWIPTRVEIEWRPYCNGHWERTERGWYWASDEPWAWATYHYGRWDWRPDVGWYWVPQTQWAPAWVSWHECDGYVGWAPLHPTAIIAPSGVVRVDVRVISPKAYVFVEPRRFLEPVRPTTVVVNNTTIINKTVNITNIKIVNKTVINEGPTTQVIERASGHPVQAVASRDLRRKTEAQAVVYQRKPAPKPVPPAPIVRGQPERREQRGVAAGEPKQNAIVTTPAPPAPNTAHAPVVAAPSPGLTPRHEPERDQHKPAQPAVESKPVTAPQVAAKEPAQSKGENHRPPAEKHVRQPERKGQRVAELEPKHEVIAKGHARTNSINKAHSQGEQNPKPREKE